ncbi:hypothetical protein F4561_003861 [Lipingzhangella halophila]|uniref:SnoaL-like domain-containing protein n=1 Tax=Lipingzhangella halophila TaxID=1783352 RepID=A0A7W7RK84_9ACTN|nr:nuclear transport factor 2 family protein [Lipingzhangella halophila]MBB4933041.1 hypothetical protein [Lipingzhangella halophila]
MPGTPSPRDVFDRFQRNVLEGGGLALTADMCAQDVIVETPVAPPGHPRRFDGREQFAAFAEAARAALAHVRFEEFRNVVPQETADPEVLIVEYEIAATDTATGRSATAPFILVLRVRDGVVTHFREYQDTAALAAFAQPA